MLYFSQKTVPNYAVLSFFEKPLDKFNTSRYDV